MITREILIRTGYATDELNNAPQMAELAGMPWRSRPNLAVIDGKLYYCRYRCLGSYRGGGCECINHPPEDWIPVAD